MSDKILTNADLAPGNGTGHPSKKSSGKKRGKPFHVVRFHSINIPIRSVRCQYGPEHEAIVRSHGKKRVEVHGKADFDRNHNPRFVVVESMKPRP